MIRTINKPEYETYQNPQELREKLLNMTIAEARKKGIAKTTLFYIKQRCKLNSTLRLNAKILKKLRL